MEIKKHRNSKCYVAATNMGTNIQNSICIHPNTAKQLILTEVVIIFKNNKYQIERVIDVQTAVKAFYNYIFTIHVNQLKYLIKLIFLMCRQTDDNYITQYWHFGTA